MRAFVVHKNPADERVALLVKLLHQLGYRASILSDLTAVSRSERNERGQGAVVILPNTGGDGELANEAIVHVESDPHAPFLIYVADAIPADAYKRLVKTRQAEWVKWQGAAREIPELIAALSHSVAPESSAKIVAFLPSKGGVGNTTLAREVAASVGSGKKKNREKVVVLDPNFQASTLADSLDLVPRFDVSEFAGRLERLDDRLLDVFTSSYSPSLDVFSSPTRFVEDHVDPQVVFSLLDGLSKRYDSIFVDIPHRWAPWVDSVLQGSDAVVITGENTVPAMKQLASRVQHAEQLSVPLNRIMIVINKCDVGLFGRLPRNAHIDRMFAGRRVMQIQRDPTVASLAANTGKPIVEVGARRPVSRSIHQLADWVKTATAPTGSSAPKSRRGTV